jgi:hypothetical protein
LFHPGIGEGGSRRDRDALFSISDVFLCHFMTMSSRWLGRGVSNGFHLGDPEEHQQNVPWPRVLLVVQYFFLLRAFSQSNHSLSLPSLRPCPSPSSTLNGVRKRK